MRYKKVRLDDVIEFNPKETLKKNDIAKKIPMDALTPFTRKVDYFELAEFKGGTKFKNNDTLMARITPCLENGKTSFVDVLEENEVGFGSTEYFVLRAKEEEIIPKYLYYLSISNTLRSAVIKSMTGTSGRQRAQKESLLNFEIFLPNITDQKKILGLLDSLDTKIELNNQMINTLEEMASTLFKRWFVDFEFPDENGNPYKSSDGKMIDSELGEIPERWEIGKLSDYGEIVGGGTPSKKKQEYYDDGNISWITPKDLSELKITFIEKGKLSITDEALKKSSAKLVPKGTVLFSSRAPIGYMAIAKNSLTTNQGFKSIVPNEIMSSFFIYLWLRRNLEVIKNLGTGSTFKEVSGGTMKNIDAIIPKPKLVSQFDEIIMPVFKLIEKCESENTSLINTRDTLLPKLLSGEIEF